MAKIAKLSSLRIVIIVVAAVGGVVGVMYHTSAGSTPAGSSVSFDPSQKFSMVKDFLDKNYGGSFVLNESSLCMYRVQGNQYEILYYNGTKIRVSESDILVREPAFSYIDSLSNSSNTNIDPKTMEAPPDYVCTILANKAGYSSKALIFSWAYWSKTPNFASARYDLLENSKDQSLTGWDIYKYKGYYIGYTSQSVFYYDLSVGAAVGRNLLILGMGVNVDFTKEDFQKFVDLVG